MELQKALEIAIESVLKKTGKQLTSVEIAVLEGAWLGQTYEEIAEVTRYSPSYLSRTVSPHLWQLLSQALGKSVGKKNIRLCLEQLEEVVEKQGSKKPLEKDIELPVAVPSARTDWGEAIDVSAFYGRDLELGSLRRIVKEDGCRLVVLLGLGGIGKTALSVKLAQQLQTEFEFVIWRSLRNAPSLEILLADLVPFLSHQRETKPELGKLLNCLKQSRCLVILDNLETLLDAQRVGQFQSVFAEYGELLRLVGEVGHQSCVVLTSREKPAIVAALEGMESTARSLRLDGSKEAAQAILQAKGLAGTEKQKQVLGERYGNSPLALKIVATSIQELFDGSIGDFLQEDTLIFNGIRRLLDQQFQRLSVLEKSIMYWLAINREWTSIAELQADIIPAVSKGRLLESLEALSFRCLLEQHGTRFTQQPVVMEYVTEQILDASVGELSECNLDFLARHALFKATAKDYIRETQRKLIVEPLCGRLLGLFPSQTTLIQHLQQQFNPLRHSPQPSYGAGNLINLLSHLKAEFAGTDFSGLTIRQADLRDTPLQQVNFTNANISSSVFADPVTDINNMVLSPDGKILVMMGLNGTLFFYEMPSGERLFSWSAHQNWSFGVAFAPDGQTLFTSSFDETLKQWDLATKQCLHIWQTDSPIWQIAVSPDGEWLASAHENGTIQLQNILSEGAAIVLNAHSGAIRDLAFHPHRNLLASASVDRTVKFWDIPTGECVLTLHDHTEGLWAIRFHPQGTYLASLCTDSDVKVWDLATGECVRNLTVDTVQINNGMAFSPDGQTLAFACQDSTIRLWDIQGDRQIRILHGHRMGVWGLAFSADGKILISSSGSAQVKFWQVDSGQCLKTLQGEMQGVWAIAFNPQGTQMLSSGDDGRIRLWSLATLKCLQTMSGHTTRIVATVYHPQQPQAASGSYDGLVKLWDLQQGRCLQTFKGHAGWVVGVAFHPTQPWLISCGYDDTIRFWSLDTGQAIRTINLESGGYVFDIAFHPQEPLFVSSSEDGIVRFWDSLSGTLLQELKGHTARVWTLAFHPQGHLLASGGHDGTVKLWDVHSGECVATWSGFGVIMSVNFSPDGRLLAANSDNLIRLWDVDSRQPLKTLEGHTNVISAVTFHPNSSMEQGYTLVSASYDETIRFWNVETGDCLQVLRPDRLYEGMDITGVTGLSEGQKAVLKQLGALDTYQ